MRHKIKLQILRQSLGDPDPNKRVKWCIENVGKRNIDWTVDVSKEADTAIYTFKDKGKATLFALVFA